MQTRPFLLTTLQLLQIFFTEALTFINLKPSCYSSSGFVISADIEQNLVAWQYFNIIHAHFTGKMREDFFIPAYNSKISAWKRLFNDAFQLLY